MKILVTNDDGIQSYGLKVLAEFAKTLGDVTVSAPKNPQSAKSHAITVHTPIEIEKVDYLDGVTAYSVDSTPVDCVRFATIGLNTQYDLIFSGINNGYNVGEDILYSGTAAAIFETSLRQTRGIAFSTERDNFDFAKQYLDKIYRYFTENGLFEYNDIYNVNIPTAVKGIRLTKQGGAYYTDEFIKTDERHFDQRGYMIYRYGSDLTLDTAAPMNGYISVTPLSTKRDNIAAYEAIKKNLK